MRTKFLPLMALVLAIGLFLSACSASRASTDFPSVTVKDDVAYLAGGPYVYLVDLKTGTELKTKNDKGETVPLRFPEKPVGAFYGEPSFTPDGQLLIGDTNISTKKHPFYFVDATTLGVKNTFESEAIDNWVAGALVLDDFIFVPNSNGEVFKFDLVGNLQDEKLETGNQVWATPVTDGKTIYITSMDHKVYAFDPASMKTIWTPVELDAAILGAPTLADGTLYVGTIGGSVYALDAASGETKWQTKPGGLISDHVAVANDLVFVSSTVGQLGKLYALNAVDGSEAWSFDSDTAIIAAPLAKDDMVIFVTEGGDVRAMDLEGKALWQDKLDEAKIYSNPVAAGDLILVAPFGKSSMMLIAYDNTGSQKWVFAPSK